MFPPNCTGCHMRCCPNVKPFPVPGDKDYPFSLPIKTHLDLKDMSQAELSRKSGLSAPMVSEVIAGKRNPSAKNLKRIAMALDVSMDIIKL